MDAKTTVGYQPQPGYQTPRSAIPPAAEPTTLCLSIVSNSKLLREGLPTLLARVDQDGDEGH